jgi:cyclophilin family peptidyl-prolyl cis-trans isomerase
MIRAGQKQVKLAIAASVPAISATVPGLVSLDSHRNRPTTIMHKLLLALTLLLSPLISTAQDELPAYPRVALETTEGRLVLELDARRAPITVRHFLALVDAGYYDGTIFHRVIPNFVAQAGGYDRDLELVEKKDAIVNESGNGLRNLRGTVAMARLSDPHTANAQFYINLADNRSLDPQGNRWGYAVFGYVVEGMEIADRIAELPTGPAGDFVGDVPLVRVVIEKASRVGN